MDKSGVRKRRKTYGVDTTIRGHRVTQGGFPSRAAAEEWAFRMRADRAALAEWLRLRLVPESPTVEQVIESYLRDHQHVDGARYQAHLLPLMGSLPADSIRQRHVRSYTEAREEQGAADKTAYNELAFLRTALRYAWRNDELAQPPRFTLSKPHCQRTRVAYPDEARRLLSLADVSLRRVVAAAWICGLRRGEIVAARWSWVNLQTRELTLPATITKTKTERVVTLPEELLDLLLEEPRHSEFLFALYRRGRNGRGELEAVPWSPQTLRRRFQDLLRRAGASGLWLHDLRRSMATIAQERGHTVAAVQRAGGWSDPSVLTRHYSAATRQAQRDVADDLAEAIGLAGTGGTEDEPKVWN